MPWSLGSVSLILGPAGIIHRDSGRRCTRHNPAVLDHSNRCRGRYGGAVHALRDGSVSEQHAHEGRVFAGVTSVPERRASWSRIGSIPAWAGEPLPAPMPKRRCRVYPRVGGGTLEAWEATLAQQGLSPRGRGNPGSLGGDAGPAGSIPAWAGEPGYHRSPGQSCRVYPRVGGGTWISPKPRAKLPGLSPRGRGNPP